VRRGIVAGAVWILPVAQLRWVGHPATATAGPYGMTTKKARARATATATADPLRGLFFAEDVSHAADLGADAAEFFFEVLVAAVEVIDAVEDGFSVGD
jgi:hypothetical protein